MEGEQTPQAVFGGGGGRESLKDLVNFSGVLFECLSWRLTTVTHS